MKIRSKLILNSLIVVILILGTIAISLKTFQEIKVNLRLLTEKTTPFQVQTLDYDRALQVIVSELIKVFSVKTPQELKDSKGKIENLLKDFQAKEAKLSELLGGERLGTSEDLNKIAQELFLTKERELNFDKEAKEAGKSLSHNAKAMSDNLSKIVEKVRAIQLNRSAQATTSIESVKDIERRIRTQQNIKILVKDLSVLLQDLSQVNEKRKLLILRNKVQFISNQIKELLKGLNRNLAQEFINLPQTFEEYVKLRGELLEKPEESLQRKIKSLESTLAEKINIFALKLDQEINELQARLKKEVEVYDVSNLQATISINALQITTELLTFSGQMESLSHKTLYASTIEELQEIEKELNKSFDRLTTIFKNLQHTLRKLNLEKELKDVEKLYSGYQNFKNLILQMTNLRKKVITQEQQLLLELEKIKGLAEAQRKRGEEKISLASEEQAKAVAEVNRAMNTSIKSLILAGAIVSILAILFGFWIYRSITKPLTLLEGVAHNLAKGYLVCSQIKVSKDEIGKLIATMCEMINTLTEIINKVQQVTNNLIEKSKLLLQISRLLNEKADVQYMEIEQSTASITEISITSADIAQYMRETSNFSEQIKNRAIESKEIINKTSIALDNYVASVEESVNKVNALAEESKAIYSILELIRNISEQIKLLALNATIEAARAGAHGRGFAVVADNVRLLAIKTATAAEEINAKIEGMLHSIDDTVNSLQKEKENLHQILSLTSSLIGSMDLIIGDIVKVNEMIIDINRSTEGQTTAIDGLNKSMVKISEVSQVVKDIVEKVLETGKYLDEASKDLKEAIDWFKV